MAMVQASGAVLLQQAAWDCADPVCGHFHLGRHTTWGAIFFSALCGNSQPGDASVYRARGWTSAGVSSARHPVMCAADGNWHDPDDDRSASGAFLDAVPRGRMAGGSTCWKDDGLVAGWTGNWIRLLVQIQCAVPGS